MTVTAAGLEADADLNAASDLGDQIAGLYHRLLGLPDLAPAPAVDALFRELVRLCTVTDDSVAARVLAEPAIRRLRGDLIRLCGRGESLLEQLWAQRVLAAADPAAELGRFPYLGNYRQLSLLETHALAGSGHVPRNGGRLCFLGGGPLPLSALLLHRYLGGAVEIVDVDPLAAGLARRVVGRLSDSAALRVTEADAASGAEMSRLLPGYDVVVVAALVGTTPSEKRAMLRAVGAAMDPGAFLLVRSASGLRTLLYAVVEPADVAAEAGCVPQLLVHPLGEVVNSVLVARRR